MAINNCVLMGRLVRDPELKSTGNGVEFCNFTIAVDRRYQSGEEKKADFLDCVAWRQTAVFVNKYFTKGAMIAVQGEIQTRNYEDRDGNKRKAVEIVVDNASFCGSKNEGSASGSAPASAEKSYERVNDLDVIVDTEEDDLPF